MPPYAERIPEPFDIKPLTEDLGNQNIVDNADPDTPSPRTPTTTGSLSPISPSFHFGLDSNAFIPLVTGDSIPYDHTLPHYLRQVSGESTLDDVRNLTLRVLTGTGSLQQMSFYTPNLRELNLEGSAISSLRDIGSQLEHLQVLRVSRCHLSRLDGTMGLTSLVELHASGNYINSAAPCAHLSRLQVLDLSRNKLQDIRTLSFLSACKHLENIRLEGNSVTSNPELQSFLQSTVRTLRFIDVFSLHTSEAAGSSSVTPSNPMVFERRDSTSDTSSSRVSSAGSRCLDTDGEDDVAGPATVVSKFTSGQILCGNVAAQRRRSFSSSSSSAADQQQQEPRLQQESSSKDALMASRRWREAYYKFREGNAARWKKENEEDINDDENHDEEDSN